MRSASMKIVDEKTNIQTDRYYSILYYFGRFHDQLQKLHSIFYFLFHSKIRISWSTWPFNHLRHHHNHHHHQNSTQKFNEKSSTNNPMKKGFGNKSTTIQWIMASMPKKTRAERQKMIPVKMMMIMTKILLLLIKKKSLPLLTALICGAIFFFKGLICWRKKWILRFKYLIRLFTMTMH